MDLDDGDGPELVVIDRDGIRRPGLVPFDSARASAAGRKGAEVRRAKRAHQAADARAIAAELRSVAGAFDRAELGPMALACAALLVGRIARGDVPVRNGEEAAAILRALVDIGRLESGDPTRTVAVAHLSGPALAARLRELQVSAAADAADDAPPEREPGGA